MCASTHLFHSLSHSLTHTQYVQEKAVDNGRMYAQAQRPRLHEHKAQEFPGNMRLPSPPPPPDTEVCICSYDMCSQAGLLWTPWNRKVVR